MTASGLLISWPAPAANSASASSLRGPAAGRPRRTSALPGRRCSRSTSASSGPPWAASRSRRFSAASRQQVAQQAATDTAIPRLRRIGRGRLAPRVGGAPTRGRESAAMPSPRSRPCSRACSTAGCTQRSRAGRGRSDPRQLRRQTAGSRPPPSARPAAPAPAEPSRQRRLVQAPAASLRLRGIRRNSGSARQAAAAAGLDRADAQPAERRQQAARPGLVRVAVGGMEGVFAGQARQSDGGFGKWVERRAHSNRRRLRRAGPAGGRPRRGRRGRASGSGRKGARSSPGRRSKKQDGAGVVAESGPGRGSGTDGRGRSTTRRRAAARRAATPVSATARGRTVRFGAFPHGDGSFPGDQ